jgi:hypothetical protein
MDAFASSKKMDAFASSTIAALCFDPILRTTIWNINNTGLTGQSGRIVFINRLRNESSKGRKIGQRSGRECNFMRHRKTVFIPCICIRTFRIPRLKLFTEKGIFVNVVLAIVTRPSKTNILQLLNSLEIEL